MTYPNTSCRGRATPLRSTGQHTVKLLRIKCSSVHIVHVGFPKLVRITSIFDPTQSKFRLLPQVLQRSCSRDALLTLQLEFMTSLPSSRKRRMTSPSDRRLTPTPTPFTLTGGMTLPASPTETGRTLKVIVKILILLMDHMTTILTIMTMTLMTTTLSYSVVQ